MTTKNLLRITFMFHITFSSAFVEKPFSDTNLVNVLAFDFTPFTYLDSSQRFVDGIDIHLLKTIAKRLDLNLKWTKVNRFDEISTEKLEYVQVKY